MKLVSAPPPAGEPTLWQKLLFVGRPMCTRFEGESHDSPGEPSNQDSLRRFCGEYEVSESVNARQFVLSLSASLFSTAWDANEPAWKLAVVSRRNLVRRPHLLVSVGLAGIEEAAGDAASDSEQPVLESSAASGHGQLLSSIGATVTLT